MFCAEILGVVAVAAESHSWWCHSIAV